MALKRITCGLSDQTPDTTQPWSLNKVAQHPKQVFGINPITHQTVCANRHYRSDKPDWAPSRSIHLLDQVRERVRYLHYSLQTEKACVYWAKAFVLWAARSFGGFRHPSDMGQAEVKGFLTMLATEKQVATATHRQALHAPLFLHRQVLGLELPWVQQIGCPPERKRIPVALTVQEVQSLLSHRAGTEALLAALLFGSGWRLREALGLRAKDADFDR